MNHDTVESVAVEKTAAIAESLTNVNAEVAKFDAINAGLQAIEQAHPLNVIVAAIDTPAGMRAAESAWRAYRNPRLEVEKARKAAKAPVLALGRAIDAFAGTLETRLLAGETHYKAQITAEEERRAAAKAEAERIERERVEGLRAGVAKLRGYVERAAGQPSEAIQRAIDALAALAFLADDWAEFAAEAQTARDETVAKLRELHAKAVAAEAQAAEAERLRVLAEQQAKELAALRAREAEREAAERAAREEADRVARETAEREARAAAELAAAKAATEKAEREAAAAQAAMATQQANTTTQDAQESGSSAGTPATYASNAAESAQVAPSGDEGPAAHADTSAADPASPLGPAHADAQHRMNQQASQALAAVEDAPMLKLGDLCARFGGLALSAAFIDDVLGVPFAKKERGAIFYTVTQASEIKQALLAMIQGADLQVR